MLVSAAGVIRGHPHTAEPQGSTSGLGLLIDKLGEENSTACVDGLGARSGRWVLLIFGCHGVFARMAGLPCIRSHCERPLFLGSKSRPPTTSLQLSSCIPVGGPVFTYSLVSSPTIYCQASDQRLPKLSRSEWDSCGLVLALGTTSTSSTWLEHR